MKFITIKTVLVLVTAILLVGLLPLESYSEDSFQIAIVRADGIIIPIGIYESGEWSNPWSKIGENQSLELKTLSDIPASWTGGERLKEKWQYWGFKGEHQTIKLLSPFKANQCDYLWGIASDFREDIEICTYCCPFPKVGVATNSVAEFRHSESYTAPAYLTNFISRNSEDIEAKEVHSLSDSENEYMRHLVRKFQGSPGKVKHDVILVDNNTGYKYYYFESERFYFKDELELDSECEDSTFLRGWIVEDTSGTLKIINGTFYVTDCDHEIVIHEKPLTSFMLDGKLFIVSQRASYESAAYVISELNPISIKKLLSTLLHAL